MSTLKSSTRRPKLRPREPHVCIGCGRRDTTDPSRVCWHCRNVREPGMAHNELRENRTFAKNCGHDRRACQPGPPLTTDDMECGV